MNEFSPSAEIIEDQPVSGFSTIVEEGSHLGEADLAGSLKVASQRLGTGLPGEQSMAGDLFRKIIARVRGRQLVRDTGMHDIDIEWLCLHVPPGGTARLQLAQSADEANGIKLSIAGTGLGDGWSYKAKFDRDFLERSHCMALVDTFRVHVQTYAFDDSTSDLEFRADVVERVKTSAREIEFCTLCDSLPGAALIMAEKDGPAIDLSADSVGQKISKQIIVAGKSEAELGISTKVLGDIGVSAGVVYKREVSFTCAVDYNFTAGRVYQPMRRFQYADLPFWRTT